MYFSLFVAGELAIREDGERQGICVMCWRHSVSEWEREGEEEGGESMRG